MVSIVVHKLACVHASIVRVFPIMVTGRHPGRCPFLIRVLPPLTGPHRPTHTGTNPLRFCSTFRPTTLVFRGLCPYPQRFCLIETFAPHRGHNLNSRELILVCCTHSHSASCYCISCLLVLPPEQSQLVSHRAADT